MDIEKMTMTINKVWQLLESKDPELQDLDLLALGEDLDKWHNVLQSKKILLNILKQDLCKQAYLKGKQDAERFRKENNEHANFSG